MRIHIQPPFYRTAWFYALAGATLVGLLLFAHWARLRSRVVHTLALERARASERELIREELSKDYHDALGHKLTKISLYTELARRSLDNGRVPTAPTGSGVHGAADAGSAVAEIRREAGDPVSFLQKVADSVESLTRETRQFIWTIDPRRDSLYETGLQLREFGDELFENSGVDFDVEGLGEGLRQWRLPMRGKQDVLLLFREALHNCLKHAQARTVRLRFEVTGRQASISVEDDGCGLTHSSSGEGRRARGAGLANMKSRARAVGGVLELTARSDGPDVPGTRVRLCLPKTSTVKETP